MANTASIGMILSPLTRCMWLRGVSSPASLRTPGAHGGGAGADSASGGWPPCRVSTCAINARNPLQRGEEGGLP
jgi:hypothetical protein